LNSKIKSIHIALSRGGAISTSTYERRDRWGKLFGFRVTWGLILGFFGIVYMVWLFQAWLPGYLEIQGHMSIRTTGFVAAIPYACGVVGSIGAGWVTDRLMAGGFSPINSRKLPIIIGLVAMAVFTFVAAETPSNVVAVMAISAAVFFAGGASGMSWALASVAAPAHCTACWVPSRISAGISEARLLPL
jgi:MFS family permease